jgi:hypothetical protein
MHDGDGLGCEPITCCDARVKVEVRLSAAEALGAPPPTLYRTDGQLCLNHSGSPPGVVFLLTLFS